MRYLSVCSGIEAATVAWHPLGWQPIAFSEIEKFPSQVLSHHYPDVPNVGDMTKFEEWKNVTNIDVLVGGTPCQSFSVAGLRKGLADPRGNLMLTYLAIAERYQPKWLVWENVPGVLSSNGGRDFGTFLGALGQLGYGFAYRVLDAQYFGVAQRRRRVFVVGYLGDWKRAAAVLFESESMSGHPAPSRKTRKDIASTITSSLGTGDPTDMTPMIAISSGSDPELMATLCAKDNEKLGCNQWVSEGKAVLQPSYALVGNTIGRKPENGGNGIGWSEEISYTLTKTDVHGVAQPIVIHGTQNPCTSDIAFAQGRNNGGENVLVQQMTVRRLTPTECERLQGFPDGYTDIKENTPDGPRYKALGNSMAVPVMRWIGQQIQKVEDICATQK
jgi:DNA (cytosine-5)-methyltransferase 1